MSLPSLVRTVVTYLFAFAMCMAGLNKVCFCSTGEMTKRKVMCVCGVFAAKKKKKKTFVHARSYVFYVLFFFLPNSTAPPTRWAPRDAGSVGAPVRALSLRVSRLQSVCVIIGTSDGRHDASLEKRARKSLALFAPFFPARRRRHPFFFSPPTARFSSFDFRLLLG